MCRGSTLREHLLLRSAAVLHGELIITNIIITLKRTRDLAQKERSRACTDARGERLITPRGDTGVKTHNISIYYQTLSFYAGDKDVDFTRGRFAKVETKTLKDNLYISKACSLWRAHDAKFPLQFRFCGGVQFVSILKET